MHPSLKPKDRVFFFSLSSSSKTSLFSRTEISPFPPLFLINIIKEKTKPVHTSFGRLLYWGLLLSCVMGYARQTDLSLHNVKTYVFVACLLLSVLLGIASRKESVFSKRN
eukprot:TRINITY_DN1382_c0_g2_i13.p1 TRINITY_DN1382_c0_g2~~TRINITY_DN1382_c0_g2_i13.p1  ORF type:complete len:110 (+),score=12.78 TRINITY_DN1382_c0_g2_i13:385-714(+)